MANIYTDIDQNKRNTVLIVAAFIAVISFIGWFFGYFFVGDGYTFLGLALIISGITSLISYYNSDKIVLAISNAHPIDEASNQYLYHLVQNLCLGAGLPIPKIYIIDDQAMNAFATGRDPQHASICFTSGIVQGLDKLELEGVAAHELSHIGNYDTRLMCIVSVLVGMVSLLGHWFTRGIFWGGGRRRGSGDSELGGIFMLIGLIFVILSPIIATLIQLAISRNREYLADASGALLTRYPKALASALEKISQDPNILREANGATAHLYISNPFKSGEDGNFFANLFSTHPPVQDRIKRLLSM
ncbi:MAG TPA: M48 family metallopeptidase [Candidatus Saccharimonadales bacterium]|nr:M48 family metallopeptidase [Candidatus Saccharimonadales bacterium]